MTAAVAAVLALITMGYVAYPFIRRMLPSRRENENEEETK